jgi:hypothetical protein
MNMSGRDGPITLEEGIMEHTTVLVREYADEQDFHTDEQKLGREGWSVQSTANGAEKQSLLMRIRARFAPTQAARLVVTYQRQVPR